MSSKNLAEKRPYLAEKGPFSAEKTDFGIPQYTTKLNPSGTLSNSG